jgi:predicted Zn-dependent protease with MMP-like domain
MTVRSGPADRADPLDLVEDALDRGDAELALRLAEQVLEKTPDDLDAIFLAAEALRDLRDVEGAEQRYRQVVHKSPDHSAAWSGLGTVLFDQLQFEGARRAHNRAVRLDPLNPEAYYGRAMLRERRGDLRGARRDYLRASHLDPSAWPAPVPLDDATVEAVVEEALRSAHPSIQVYLQQVAFLLEEVPDEETCRQFDPPAFPGDLLGYFSGPTLMDRSVDNPWSNLPSAILLFRRNLERIAWDRDRLLEELRVTVLHEVGHYLGLDEDDLADRSLD